MKISGKFLLIGILLTFSVVLLYDSLSNYINPYLTISEISENVISYRGKTIQVMGRVKEGSIQRDSNGSIIFTITDGTSQMNVHYTGGFPQNLDAGKDVVVVGAITDTEQLEAEKILVKCPSKYNIEQDTGVNSHLFLTGVAITIIILIYLTYTTLSNR